MQDGSRSGRSLDWNAARDFLAVARAGSLARAAFTLGVNATTVGRRIEALERSLGVALFQRAQTGYALTDEGRALVGKAERIETAAAAFASGAQSGGAVRGHVRLATAEELSNAIVIPALADLRARHPELTVEVVTDVRSVNLHRREADLALRLVRPTQGNVTLRKLATMRYGLYGSRRYVEERERVDGPVDGAAFDADGFVAWPEAHADLPAARWIERRLVGRSPALIATTLRGHVVAAQQGFGLAVLPRFLADEAGLVHIPSDADALGQDLWLVLHADLAASARVRAVAGCLITAVERNGPALKGEG